MKLITFTVPCYNSADYMHICIDSIIAGGGNKVEIIIVNDGSKDSTGSIADGYKEKYPDIIKVVHQENGGHGEGINQGIRNATGKYFKVVDSDDWVGVEELKALIRKLEALEEKSQPDLIVTNYVYYKKDMGADKVITYKNVFSEGEVIGWEDTKSFNMSQYLTLHSCMFKTEILRASGVVLPKHTFYEDNYYVYAPLPLVEKILYLSLDFYYYLIGRDGQSVGKDMLVKRHMQQVKVSTLVFEEHNLNEIKKENKILYKRMYHHLRLMMLLATLFTRLNDSEETDRINKEMWDRLMEEEPALAKKLKYMSPAAFINLPGKSGRVICKIGYNLAHKVVNFN